MLRGDIHVEVFLSGISGRCVGCQEACMYDYTNDEDNSDYMIPSPCVMFAVLGRYGLRRVYRAFEMLCRQDQVRPFRFAQLDVEGCVGGRYINTLGCCRGVRKLWCPTDYWNLFKWPCKGDGK